MSGQVSQNHEARNYYCTESLELVNSVFSWYFRLFGYCKHESIEDL